MTRIESEKFVVDKSIEQVYAFLSDMRNYAAFMPEDVKSFEPEEETAKLNLQGLGELRISMDEKREPEYIKIMPGGNMPVKFHMFWELENVDGGTQVTGGANAELNMFMKMMVEPRLKAFINGQTENLKKAIEENA
jgi:carbon monoxide dehydrogenase subunit G